MRTCTHETIREVKMENGTVIVCRNCCADLMIVHAPSHVNKNELRKAASSLALSEKYREAPREKRKYSVGSRKIYL
jgi:hypothetical protein